MKLIRPLTSDETILNQGLYFISLSMTSHDDRMEFEIVEL